MRRLGRRQPGLAKGQSAGSAGSAGQGHEVSSLKEDGQKLEATWPRHSHAYGQVPSDSKLLRRFRCKELLV